MAALDVVCHPDRLPRQPGRWPVPPGDVIAVPVEAPWLGEAVVCLAGADGLALIDVETRRRWAVPHRDVWDVRCSGRTVRVQAIRVADGWRTFDCADAAEARRIAAAVVGVRSPVEVVVVAGRVVRWFAARIRRVVARK